MKTKTFTSVAGAKQWKYAQDNRKFKLCNAVQFKQGNRYSYMKLRTLIQDQFIVNRRTNPVTFFVQVEGLNRPLPLKDTDWVIKYDDGIVGIIPDKHFKNYAEDYGYKERNK